MRFRPLALLIIGLLASCGAEVAAPAADHGPWRLDTLPALAEAKTAKRPALLLFTAVWCPPCQQMEKEVLPQPEVVAALARVQPIRVDADDAAAEDLFRRYHVQGTPTLLLVDAEGKETGRLEGFQAASAVIGLLPAK